MRFALLVYQSEKVLDSLADDIDDSMMISDRSAISILNKSGNLRSCLSLMSTDLSTTSRTRGDQFIVSSGPFEETREQLQHIFEIEVECLDDALSLIRSLSFTKIGSVEIRPINRFVSSFFGY